MDPHQALSVSRHSRIQANQDQILQRQWRLNALAVAETIFGSLCFVLGFSSIYLQETDQNVCVPTCEERSLLQNTCEKPIFTYGEGLWCSAWVIVAGALGILIGDKEKKSTKQYLIKWHMGFCCASAAFSFALFVLSGSFASYSNGRVTSALLTLILLLMVFGFICFVLTSISVCACCQLLNTSEDGDFTCCNGCFDDQDNDMMMYNGSMAMRDPRILAHMSHHIQPPMGMLPSMEQLHMQQMHGFGYGGPQNFYQPHSNLLPGSLHSQPQLTTTFSQHLQHTNNETSSRTQQNGNTLQQPRIASTNPHTDAVADNPSASADQPLASGVENNVPSTTAETLQQSDNSPSTAVIIEERQHNVDLVTSSVQQQGTEVSDGLTETEPVQESLTESQPLQQSDLPAVGDGSYDDNDTSPPPVMESADSSAEATGVSMFENTLDTSNLTSGQEQTDEEMLVAPRTSHSDIISRGQIQQDDIVSIRSG